MLNRNVWSFSINSNLKKTSIIAGTALEALTSMQTFLRGRPTVFKSLEHAIEWRYMVYLKNYYSPQSI